MKLLLCAIASKYIHSALAPWYLLSAIRESGREVDALVVEGSINEPIQTIVDRILAERPDVVGFSTYIWNVNEVLSCAQRIREASPQTVLFLGGPEVSYRPRELLETHPYIDYIIGGEGEHPIVEFIEALQGDRGMAAVSGLSFRSGVKLHLASPHETTLIPASPYSEGYFSSLNGRIAYLETSRGCPFSCAFCLSGQNCGVRFFPLDRAKEELLLLANSGTKTVKLVDRTFNCDIHRAKEIWSFLIDCAAERAVLPDDICFHFEVAGDLFDSESLTLLKTAPPGLFQFEIGIQSFHDETLAAVARKTDTDKVYDTIAELLSYKNIHIHVDLIAGLPYEGLRQFEESFDRAFSLRPHMLQLGFLKLLYGSDLRSTAGDIGITYHATSPYEVNKTPWITEEELSLLHRVEDALERVYNSGRFLSTLDYFLEETGLTPFSFFMALGNFIENRGGALRLPLEDYAKLLFTFGETCGYSGGKLDGLQDRLILDWLSVINTGRLPAFLRRRDPRLKAVLTHLESDAATRRPQGHPRGIAPLSDGSFVYADYDKKPSPITKRYHLYYVSL